MSGAEKIAAERQRQIDAEGWTPEHDDKHAKSEMLAAARCYATLALRQVRGNRVAPSEIAYGYGWPWSWLWWKPSDDPVRNLVKAGALIAAEIDRLERGS